MAVSYTHLDVYKRQFKDFVAITQTVRFPLVLGANPGVPGDNLKEFLRCV